MESQLMPPQQGHAQAHEVDPQGAGHRYEGEEKHHDEKPAMMSRVKEKVNKIRNKMGIKKHDDGPDRESDSSSEVEVEGENEGYKEDDDPNITSAPISASVPQRVSIGDSEKAEPVKERLGDFTGDVKEDPAAPQSTNPPAGGGEEIGISPIIQNFETIAASNEPKTELEPNEPKTEVEPNETKTELESKSETQLSDATGSTDQPNVTYTEKLKTMATVPAEYGKNIASTVYDKLSYAGSAVVQKIRGGPTTKDESETSREVNQDKRVSVKEYISEKLKPGEEDQALSDVISEVVQRNKVEIGSKAKKNVATVQSTTSGGTQIAEKVRGAVTSVVGGGKGTNDATTVASDPHQEKGSHEAAEPMKLD